MKVKRKIVVKRNSAIAEEAPEEKKQETKEVERPKFYLSTLPKIDVDKLVIEIRQSIHDNIEELGNDLIASVKDCVLPQELQKVRETLMKLQKSVLKKVEAQSRELGALVTSSFEKVKI